LTLRWLFMDQRRLHLVGRMMRLYQSLGLQTLVRRSGVLKLFPARLRELEAMTPPVQEQFSDELIAPTTPAMGEKKYRVAMLTGCAQDLIFSDVNRDTVEVLARNGCEVITPPEQNCCGSLHAHNGEWELAQHLARRQIDHVPPEQFDAIITNAAGCGSHLKHYSKLLAGDAVYHDRAELWDAKVKDIHEWLVEIKFRAPGSGFRVQPRGTPTTELGTRNSKLETLLVTYHEACHLCHGQKISAQPREVLRAIPNLRLIELPESTWCCGSAGIYNLVQPEMANDLLERKLKHIKSTGAEVVATGNPGCLLQIVNGAKRENLPLRVVHPVTLLAQAYRNDGPFHAH
jgi:glycolate oxidase iron-sulfur subunit